MKQLISLTLIALLSACAAPKEISYKRYDVADLSITQGKTLFIKADLQNDVRFQGYYDYDDLGLGANPVTYQSPNAVGLIAEVLIHAVTVEAMKNEAKTATQNQADMVLLGYRRYIQEFEGEELLSSVIQGLDDNYDFRIIKHGDDFTEDGWILWSEPVFYMTQNQQELVLRHGMYITSIINPDVVLHRNLVEVASAPATGENPMDYWISDNNLPLVSGELYAHSLQVFIADALDQYNDLQNTEKTFRFKQGGETQFERGTLVQQSCGKTTIKTLRGGFKTYPSQQDLRIADIEGELECETRSLVDLDKTVRFNSQPQGTLNYGFTDGAQ